jgi:signal transduction histidine kinase
MQLFLGFVVISVAWRGADAQESNTSKERVPLVATQYALTSANDLPARDPQAWRLLGSNDDGQTWIPLDVRQGVTFADRLQRRVFALTNQAAFRLFRLQIEAVREPATAGAVQLAEIELISPPDSPLFDPAVTAVVTAQGQKQPDEVVENLFDGQPGSKWLDFANQHSATRASWVQWSYLRGESPTISNATQLAGLSERDARRGLPVQLDGWVVGLKPRSDILCLIDASRTLFSMQRPAGEARPGQHVYVQGRTSMADGGPQVAEAKLETLDDAPTSPQRLQPDVTLPGTNDFLWAEVEGTVDFITPHPGRLRLELADGLGALRVYVMEADIEDKTVHKGARIAARGLCEVRLNERRERVPGVLWVTRRSDLTMILPASDLWARHPLVPLAQVVSSSRGSGDAPVRVQGRLLEQTLGDALVIEDQGQRLVANSAQRLSVPSASWVEIVGKPGGEPNRPTLDASWFRVIASSRAGGDASAAAAAANPSHLPVLTTVKEVKALTPQEASRKYPVRLRGVVTYVFEDNTSAILQDATAGLYVSAGNSPFLSLRAGLLIQVEGESSPGEFAPSVNATRRTIIGPAKLPEPSRASADFLLTGQNENVWIEHEGVIRTLSPDPPRRFTMTVMGRGSQFPVTFYQPDLPSLPTNLTVDTAIRLRGVCGAIWNDRRQNIGFRMFVPDVEEIEVLGLAPADPFAISVQAITNLMQWEGTKSLTRRVKVQGTVTLCADKELFFLQGETGALRVRSTQAASLKPGDRVEVVGFPEPQGFSSLLSEPLVRVVGNAALPAPKLTTLDDLMKGRHDAARVRMEARLIGQMVQGDQQQLALQIDQHFFHAALGTNRGLVDPIPPGSRVVLTGVCLVAVDASRTPQAFDLFLNAPSDVAVLERPPWWSLKHTLMVTGVLGVVLLGALGWIRALRRRVEERTHELKAEMEGHKRTSASLREKTELLHAEIEERKRTEAKLEKVHRELVDASRRAGMAEVATGVLHNVGNVLNSVNVSTNLISERVKASHVTSVGKLAQLLSENSSDLSRFFTEDERGRQLPGYVAKLAQHLVQEQRTLLEEFESLIRNVDHIKEIVATQQSYAKRAGAIETIAVTELVEDALRIHTQAYLRHGVKVVREFSPTPPLSTDRHKVLQILVNLLSNAKYACDEGGAGEKAVTVRVRSDGPERVRIEVEDKGIGIPTENLTRIFNHGFTTRKGGHGYGLHSGALAAKELGGSLTAYSEGLGKGAAFALELPLNGDQTAQLQPIANEPC